MSVLLVEAAGDSLVSSPADADSGRGKRRWWRRHAAVLPIVTLSLVLHCWGLTSVGWGNAYYAAAVRSMSMNWHNFLYASFDPGGFVAVDKPPLSLWVQAIVVRIFGFSELSLLLPQALAGTAAVVLLYAGVRTAWGRNAGLVAALALALTPINVMINHSNNTDSLLVLVMTAAAVSAITAAKHGRLRWLVLATALAGSAMTAKMLAAAPVMPGVILAYFWCAPRRWTVRLGHSFVGLAVMAVAGLWWFTVVDLTPEASRPYVGSSATNSAFQLAFERNGVNQVEGAAFGGGGPANRGRPGGAGLPGAGGRVFSGPGRGGGGPGLGLPRRGFNGGEPAALRLFNADLGTQLAWLIPLGLVGGLSALWRSRLRGSPPLAAVVVLGGWFVAGASVFSFTKGIVHPYYLANIGPPVAGLVGLGAASLCADLRQRRGHALLLVPAAFGLTAVTQWRLLGLPEWSEWRPWLRVVSAAGLTVIGVAAAVTWVARRWSPRPRLVIGVGAAAAMLSPGLWTQGAVADNLAGPLPYAAVATTSALGIPGMAPTGGALRPNGGFTFPAGDQAGLVAYLRAQRRGERWLVGVQSAAQAEAIIIEFGEPVMAMGGFSGNDPILDVAALQARIADSQIRFFLLPSGVGALFPGQGGSPGRDAVVASGSGNGPAGPDAGVRPGPGGGLAVLLPGVDLPPVAGLPSGPRPSGSGPPGSGPPGSGRLGSGPSGLAGPRGAGGGLGFGPRGGFGARAGLQAFVVRECAEVPAAAWRAGNPGNPADAGQISFAGGPTSAAFLLYDCGALREAAGR